MSATGSRRRDQIVHLATTTGLASVEELSRTFEVTASTIRRDLARLNTEGRLARTYGGAMALTAHPEANLRQRTGEAFEAKRAIARWAASRIVPGESVFLDAGTTVGALAHELRGHKPLTVTTSSLTALQELGDVDTLDVQCLGGTLRPLSQSFIGPLAEAALEQMTFDRAFLGTDGVTAEHGLCEADHRQTRLKQLVARRSQRVYVLAHAAKLGRRPFHAWTRLAPPWTLVTDTAADPETVKALRGQGITVTLVGLGQGDGGPG
ncbi:DeoR/GlpR family DNA-binding transcription regulator [Streptomyces niveus]|uniref:DeoR/GlpR family DNA-binding transcription regulator n=1 Tax=Streptomyces niveus TaxID=193462 RepID=UPI003666EC49